MSRIPRYPARLYILFPPNDDGHAAAILGHGAQRVLPSFSVPPALHSLTSASSPPPVYINRVWSREHETVTTTLDRCLEMLCGCRRSQARWWVHSCTLAIIHLTIYLFGSGHPICSTVSRSRSRILPGRIAGRLDACKCQSAQVQGLPGSPGRERMRLQSTIPGRGLQGRRGHRDNPRPCV